MRNWDVFCPQKSGPRDERDDSGSR